MRAALVAICIAAVATPALAKEHKTDKSAKSDKKSDKSDRKSDRSDKHKKGKHESTAVSRDHKFRAESMPNGWSWPPTHAMAEQEKVCEAKLDDQGVAWTAGKPDGRIVDAVTLPDFTIDGVTFIGYSQASYVMDCQLVHALATFAPTLYGLGVREVHFGSIFRWTKVRAFGKTENVLSRHALGIAMDIVSFIDDTGREAIVGRDYKKNDALLLAVEQAVNASGLFRILLTPKNDPRSHSDHFHVEAALDFDQLAASK